MMKIRTKILLLSGAFAGAIWLLDVMIEYARFPEYTFLDTLFNVHRPHDLFMRSLLVVISLLFGWILTRVVEEGQVQLKNSEKDLRITLNSIGDAVIAADLEGRITKMNPVAERLTGWSVQEALGKPVDKVFRIINAYSREPAEHPVEEVLRTGLVVGLANHTLLISRDGEEYQIEDSGAPILDARGECRGVVVVFRDVSAEYHQKQLFETTLEALEHPFLVLNAETYGVELANPAARLTSRDLEDATCYSLGHGLSDPCEGENHPCPLQLIKADRESVIVEHTHFTASGEPREYEVHAHPILDYQGEVKQVIEYSLDITERKKAERELREYSKNLEREVEVRTRELREIQEELIRKERLAVLGQLAGSVGHELRNPLAVMSNAIYFLKLNRDEEKVQEYLGILADEINNGERIVADLLDYSREISPQLEPVPLIEMVENTLGKMVLPPEVVVQLDFPRKASMVLVDPIHFRHVLENLISNAFQAMPEGGSITIGSHEIRAGDNEEQISKNRIEIVIRDTGDGIPDEHRDQIFEPLFTTRARGIGLGLAITKKLVEANQGRITFSSQVGAGTTFRVQLLNFEEEQHA